MQKKVGFIVGSLRREAYSKKVAAEMADRLSGCCDVEIIPIDNLPVYNQDFDDEGTAPEGYAAFRARVREKDAFVFVTPEYNRSMPAAIKNALDVASRPYGENCWAKKPAAIVSVSPGKIGGFGANHHLRQTAVFLDLYVMAQPETYVGGIADALGEDGRIADAGMKGYLQSVADAFAGWMENF